MLLVAAFTGVVSETQCVELNSPYLGKLDTLFPGVEPIPPADFGLDTLFPGIEPIPPAGFEVDVFDPDYPIGIPRSLGGTGYVTEKTDGNDLWHNANNWGKMYTSKSPPGYYGTYHSGEDWNYEGKGGSAGRSVYSIESGTVVDIKEVLWVGHNFGSGVVIEHSLPNGEKIYSLYEHINIDPDIISRFRQRGTVKVEKGDQIGTIASITELTPHLHFEIRTKPNSGDLSKGWDRNKRWNPNALSNGYYASTTNVENEGLVDPSKSIDHYRFNAQIIREISKKIGSPSKLKLLSGTPLLTQPTSEVYSNSNPPEVTHPGVITVVNRPEGYPPGGNSGWVPCV